MKEFNKEIYDYIGNMEKRLITTEKILKYILDKNKSLNLPSKSQISRFSDEAENEIDENFPE